MIQSTFNFGNITLNRVGHRYQDGQEIDWLVENVWSVGGTGMMIGPPKQGKTWTLVDLAVSIASDTPFLGKFKVKQGPVIIFSPESPEKLLEGRIRQVAERRSLNYAELDIYIIGAYCLYLDDEDDQKTILKAVEAISANMIIFDTLAQCFKGEENRSEDVNVMANFLRMLAIKTGCASLISHHMNKRAGSKRKGDQIRGSGALHGFGDCYTYLDSTTQGGKRIQFELREGEPAEPCLLQFSKVDGATALTAVADEKEGELKPDLGNCILLFLLSLDKPISQRDIRISLGGANDKYKAALNELREAGLTNFTKQIGWELTVNGKKTAEDLKGGPVRHSPIDTNRTGPQE